ncbi:MAG: elongation factor Ts [Clostridia bacterium]|nr:elongation factor Ts [Clostridia bacterium]
MSVTAAMVKELRERTGAGMMDCKKALVECEADMEKAIDFLREKGLAAAAKKAGRIAAEGMVDAYVNADGTGVVIEVNCETDFVANTDRVKALCRDFAKHVAVAAPANVDEMLNQPFYDDDAKTVQDMIGEATASIGEKISIRRFTRFVPSGDTMVETYVHMGGRIGVMLEVKADVVDDEVKTNAHDLTMHIAAANPLFVRREEVPNDNLEKEREVLTQQALNEGKPEKIVERMVEGRIEKYYKEVCLLEQPFVKDPDISVKKLLGDKMDVVRFVRYERGEGLEKRHDDLAADIAAEQAKMKK